MNIQKHAHTNTPPHHIIPPSDIPENLPFQTRVVRVDMPKISQSHSKKVSLRNFGVTRPAADDCEESEQEEDVANLQGERQGLGSHGGGERGGGGMLADVEITWIAKVDYVGPDEEGGLGDTEDEEG